MKRGYTGDDGQFYELPGRYDAFTKQYGNVRYSTPMTMEERNAQDPSYKRKKKTYPTMSEKNKQANLAAAYQEARNLMQNRQ